MSAAPVPLIALDPSTRCGWALGCGGAPRHGVANLDQRGGRRDRPPDPYHARAGRMEALLDRLSEDLIAAVAAAYAGREVDAPAGPAAVVCEDATAFMGRGKSVGHELRGVVQAWCARHGHAYIGLAPVEVKRIATGRGNADKPAMVAAAQALLGYNGRDDNEADALWVYQWGAQHLTSELVARLVWRP